MVCKNCHNKFQPAIKALAVAKNERERDAKRLRLDTSGDEANSGPSAVMAAPAMADGGRGSTSRDDS
eukprot:1645978-Prymnesium_polylepis.1